MLDSKCLCACICVCVHVCLRVCMCINISCGLEIELDQFIWL